MKKISIHLVLLGTPRHMSAIKALQAYHSDLFSIQSTSTIAQLPNTDLYDWSYSKKLIGGLFNPDCDADITVAILENKIEGNYFIHRLTDKSAVLTFYEVDDILRDVNINSFNYLLSSIYKLITLYNLKSGFNSDSYNFIHDDTRSCIFDMTGNKYDIVYSTSKACLCQQCEAHLLKNSLPENFIPTLKKELKKIRKSTYTKIVEFIKKHPVLSLLITIVASVTINILSSYIFHRLTIN